MNRVLLYPYPRLEPANISWSAWRIVLDGHEVTTGEFTDAWDANSAMEFSLSVSIPSSSLLRMRGGNPVLLLSASCAETAFTDTAETPFVASPTSLTAAGSLSLSGADISQKLTLRAQVLMPVEAQGRAPEWTSRRILGEARALDLELDSDLSGFPTSARSFSAAHLPDAPWDIKVTATDLSDSFSNSIRLYLNEDYPLVRELMNGKPKPHVEAELSASIARTLLNTSRRLWDMAPEIESPDDVAAQHPDSIAAAGKRVAGTYLRMNLAEAIHLIRSRPETVEFRVASAAGVLKGRS
ncbi:hypothetical protein [Pseudoclavibacter helvolus]|uniref:hypothetical protein n=1 Tax=Pseudoclavibacter helvolus TaxID=255205 RepID=UPI003C74795B